VGGGTRKQFDSKADKKVAAGELNLVWRRLGIFVGVKVGKGQGREEA